MDTSEAGRKGAQNRWAKVSEKERKEVGRKLAEASAMNCVNRIPRGQ